MALLPPSSSIPQPWAGLLNLNKRLHTLCLPTEIEEMLPWMICISSKRRNGFSFPSSSIPQPGAGLLNLNQRLYAYTKPKRNEINTAPDDLYLPGEK